MVDVLGCWRPWNTRNSSNSSNSRGLPAAGGRSLILLRTVLRRRLRFSQLLSVITAAAMEIWRLHLVPVLRSPRLTSLRTCAIVWHSIGLPPFPAMEATMSFPTRLKRVFRYAPSTLHLVFWFLALNRVRGNRRKVPHIRILSCLSLMRLSEVKLINFALHSFLSDNVVVFVSAAMVNTQETYDLLLSVYL